MSEERNWVAMRKYSGRGRGGIDDRVEHVVIRVLGVLTDSGVYWSTSVCNKGVCGMSGKLVRGGMGDISFTASDAIGVENTL